MNNEIQHVLAVALARYGRDTVFEIRRTEAIVRDVCAFAPRERNVLIFALRTGVPGELQAARGSDEAALVERFARRLQDEHALDPGAARWAVETWAGVLREVAAHGSGRDLRSDASVGGGSTGRGQASRTERKPSAQVSTIRFSGNDRNRPAGADLQSSFLLAGWLFVAPAVLVVIVALLREIAG